MRWAITAAVVAVLGVGGYVVYRRLQSDDKRADLSKQPKTATAAGLPLTSVLQASGGGNAGSTEASASFAAAASPTYSGAFDQGGTGGQTTAVAAASSACLFCG